MTNSATISANWVTDGGQNRPLSALKDAIAARAKFLGESSEKATIATAINVLKSLRAETGTAKKKPKIINGNWVVDIEESGVVTGWAYPPKKAARGRRVFRSGHGSKALDTFNGGKIVNLAGSYKSGGNGKAFTLSISNTLSSPSRPFYPSRGEKFLVIANSRDDVARFAEQRILRRIGQYRGISKRALGIAMHALGSSGRGESVSDGVARIVDRLVHVKTYGSGYSSGEFGVSVSDDLPRAVLALKSGTSGLDIAVKKAANSSAAVISRIGSMPLGSKVATPFPEVVKKRVSK